MDKFLEHLLSRNKINDSQARLVENILESSTFFGVLALRQNMVTPEQLEKVILEQYHGKNKRIGEMLVDEEILTRHEVDEILKIQAGARTSINKIIVDLDILSQEEIDAEEQLFNTQSGE